jgi:hypothetical protein
MPPLAIKLHPYTREPEERNKPYDDPAQDPLHELLGNFGNP